MNLLGIDVGTTSLKAAVFNSEGKMLSSATVDYTLLTEGDRVEFTAERYWEIAQEAIRKVSAEHRIDALAIDTQGETLILADEKGTPLCNAVVWLDNRAAKEAEEIEQAFGRKRIYEVTGQPEVTATWPACKLLWFQKHKPELWSRVRKIFLLEDYLLYRLTGEFAAEKTLQSSTLYFDIRSGNWWDEMLDYLHLTPEMLPHLSESGTLVGKVGETAVVTGAIDQIAGAIGAGVVHKGLVSEMTGTTMAVFVPSESIPPFDPDSIVPCHYNFDGSYCLLSWSPTAGMALKWFKNNLCEQFSFRELDKLAGSVAPGSNGLVFLPYLCGSTMPKYNPEARASFTGLTLEHSRGHFVRSVLESVACMLHGMLDYLKIDAEEIRAMGGGAESPLWCQIKADMTGKRLVTLENRETACLGAAILAGVGARAFQSVETACAVLVKPGKIYTPGTMDYSAVYQNYCEVDALLNRKDD